MGNKKQKENKSIKIDQLLMSLSESAYEVRNGAHSILKENRGVVGKDELVAMEEMVKHIEMLSVKVPELKKVIVELSK